MPLYPQSATSQGVSPDSLPFRYFQEVWECVMPHLGQTKGR
jgi:hypothetical protein